MAIGSKGSGGGGANSSSGTTYNFTTATNSCDANEFLILTNVTDNNSSSDGDNNEHTSVTGGTGTWTKLGEYTNSEGGAGNGITVSLWLFEASGSNAVGTVFALNYANAIVDKCSHAWVYTKASGFHIEKETGTTNPVTSEVSAANGFGSSSFSSLASIERLYYRGAGKEVNSTTSLTVSTNFTQVTPLARSRNNAAAVVGRSEFRINTSTGETSNPTMAVAGDTAGLFVALKEVADGGGTSDISGTAALAFGGTNTLLGSGALAGVAALAIAGTNTLLGSGALAGIGALVFGGIDTLSGSGALAGVGALVFSGTNTLTSIGVLAGAAALVFSGTNTLEGTGSLAGSAALTVGGTNTLIGTGTLAGSADLAFTGTNTLLGMGTLAGAAALIFAGTNALEGSGSLAGSSDLVFGNPVASSTEIQEVYFNGGTSGILQLEIASIGLILATDISQPLSTWQTLFSQYGTVSSITGGLRFTFNVSGYDNRAIDPFTITFDLTNGSGVTTATIVEGSAGSTGLSTLTGMGALLGQADLTFTGTNTLGGTGELLGVASLVLTASGTVTDNSVVSHFVAGLLEVVPRVGGTLIAACNSEGSLQVLKQRTEGLLVESARVDGLLVPLPRISGKLE